MNNILAAAVMATTPQNDVVVEYPTHTWSSYQCEQAEDRIKCPSSPQSFISDIGDVHIVNNAILYCVKHEFDTVVIFDCTNVSNP